MKLPVMMLPVILCAAWQLAAARLHAQPAAPATAASEDDGFVVRDSDVGYLDSAVLGNMMRLRFDSAHALDRPNRAEYFYARAQPQGSGLPFPEVEVDSQDVLVYLERRTNDWLSLFGELGARDLNPLVNQNTTGLSDLSVGCKLCVWESLRTVATAQLRVYAPTGDADRGLGTGHASLEPGLLTMYRLDRQWTASAQVHYWTSLDGSAFAGELIRYGVGLQYDSTGCHWWRPVVELVGWTVLDGGVSFSASPGGPVTSADASGDTIINAKLGARISVTCDTDVYVGYGRAITGDRWYENVFRAELRYTF